MFSDLPFIYYEVVNREYLNLPIGKENIWHENLPKFSQSGKPSRSHWPTGFFEINDVTIEDELLLAELGILI